MSFSSVGITEGAPGFPTHWVIFTQNLKTIDVQSGRVWFRGKSRPSFERGIDQSARIFLQKETHEKLICGHWRILVSHINFPWKPQRPQPKEKMCVGFRNKRVTLDAVASLLSAVWLRAMIQLDSLRHILPLVSASLLRCFFLFFLKYIHNPRYITLASHDHSMALFHTLHL